MNLFAIFETHVRDAVAALAADGDLPRRARPRPRRRRAAARCRAHGDLATNAAMVLAKEAGHEAARPRRADRRASSRRDPDVATVEVAGPGFINLTLEPSVLGARRSPRILRARRAPMAAATSGGGERGQCRVRLGQPDRPDACRPLPRRGLRRRAGEPARRRRLRGDARVLHQRCRRPGRRARPLRLSCATARRWARRSAIPEGLYPGDYLKPVGEALAAAARPRAARRPEAEWLPIVRDAAIEAMMALIRDDLALAQRPPRRLLLGALAADAGRHRRADDRRSCRAKGDVYEGRAAAAQGPARRGLGGPRADAVPRDRLRRRRRPAADEVGRQLDLFRLRHRLSPRQVRPRLRRP